MITLNLNVPATLKVEDNGYGGAVFTIAIEVLGFRYTVRQQVARDQVGELRTKLERHVATIEAVDAAAEGGAA